MLNYQKKSLKLELMAYSYEWGPCPLLYTTPIIAPIILQGPVASRFKSYNLDVY